MGLMRLERLRVPKQGHDVTAAQSDVRPKVCLLIGTLGLGGAEKQLVLLARGLHRRGVPTHVVTLFRTGPRENMLREAGVPVTNLGVGKLSLTPYGVARAVSAVYRLAHLLRKERPDVLHAFLFVAYVLAPVAQLFARIPVLVAGRRSLGDYKDGHRLAMLIERIATTRTRLLIANADAVARDTLSREKVSSEKVTVVYNGLPRSAFDSVEPAEIPEPVGPILVCVANLKVYKGHRILLEAMAALRQRGNPVTAILIGDGPERTALASQAASLDVDARFLGHRTDVGRYLASADVSVLPSHTEGMSNAVMEAMAAGLPIVATDVGGTAELISGRGILVPPCDCTALTDALARVLQDPRGSAQMGRRARQFAQAHLGEDVMVDRYLDIYRDLVSR